MLVSDVHREIGSVWGSSLSFGLFIGRAIIQHHGLPSSAWQEDKKQQAETGTQLP